MACSGSFPSSSGEKHPILKSGQGVDSDYLGCTISCQGDETDTTFLCTFFWIFVPDFRLLQLTLEL